MTSKQALQKALQLAESGVNALADMKDAPLMRPCKDGNHAMWIAGHLTVAEGRLHKMLFGTPNPYEHWKPLFDWGSTPIDDAAKYPQFDEVLDAFKRLRTKTNEYVSSVTDAQLSDPIKTPAPGLPVFDNVGNTILTLAMHQAGHTGEALVVRRAAGKQPFFNPSAELRAF